MAAFREVPLNEIDEWPKDLVEKLRQTWITTAEQVVAAGATPEGLENLANHLGISVEKIVPLVDAARSSLSPDLVAELETPVDTSEYGLGVLRPPANEGEDSQ